MIKNIGYACINLNLKPRGFQECRLNSVYKYGIDYLRDKIINNLILTKDILRWNIENQIFMYRITSTLFPLVTHPDIIRDFKWDWQQDDYILMHMSGIKDIAEKNNIRLSMHPDQFTVLNSTNDNVVESSIDYLRYHCQVLERLGGSDIIIHTGGVYGNKQKSMDRFIKNFYKLDENIQNMLRLENDDISYNIDDIFYISDEISIPIVLDIHHHRCNHQREISKEDIIKIKNSWNKTGLVPKIHISSGKTAINDKKHSDYIRCEDLKDLLDLTEAIDIDLMVEAKKKEEAVLDLKSFLL